MVNSSVNNGMPFHANKEMLTDWFKVGLNWDGMIVTDWADINNLYVRDHIAADKKEAIEIAINAGIDMSMDPYSVDFCDLLKELVNEGRVKMSRIDDAVRRILRLKYRLNLMDKSTWDIDTKTLAKKYNKFASDNFAKEAIAMAEECIVLLKNEENILPLKKGTKILVTGPNSNSYRAQNGGWSYSWQGDRANEACKAIGKYKTFPARHMKLFFIALILFSLGATDSSYENTSSCLQRAKKSVTPSSSHLSIISSGDISLEPTGTRISNFSG